MPMTANGLAKLIEECGELMQVAGKRLAYYHTNHHPDCGDPINIRLEDEIADVLAACRFYAQTAGLRSDVIADRVTRKLERFRQWHAMPDNNQDGIDRTALETPVAPSEPLRYGPNGDNAEVRKSKQCLCQNMLINTPMGIPCPDCGRQL